MKNRGDKRGTNLGQSPILMVLINQSYNDSLVLESVISRRIIQIRGSMLTVLIIVSLDEDGYESAGTLVVIGLVTKNS